jgi:hypothetical protein
VIVSSTKQAERLSEENERLRGEMGQAVREPHRQSTSAACRTSLISDQIQQTWLLGRNH